MSEHLSAQARRDADTALRQSAAGVVGFAQALMHCVVACCDRERVGAIESALQAGGMPLLRVGMLPGGAELVLTVEGQPGAALELFAASGTVPDERPH